MMDKADLNKTLNALELEDLKKQYLTDSPPQASDTAKLICRLYKITYANKNFYSYEDESCRCIEDDKVRELILDVTGSTVPFSKVDEIFKFAKVYAHQNSELLNNIVLSSPRVEPSPLDKFLESDIPPIEYFINPILPVKGKMMISASANIGKSIFVQNLCLAMTTGMTRIFDKWNVMPARVLYVDLEMGNSPMKDRFSKMCGSKNISTDKLHVVHLPCINLLEAVESEILEDWLQKFQINVCVLDPLGHAWAGNENDNEEVSKLTRRLNQIIDKFQTSIVLVHHWRKATKDFQEGGEMAAGSYRWNAWLDSHICLKGEPHNITVSCQKNRHATRFKPWIAKIDTESLWIEHIAEQGKANSKTNDNVLRDLFQSFGQQEIRLVEMYKEAEKRGICKRNTLIDAVIESKSFKVSGEGKNRIVRLAEVQEEYLVDPELSS